mmetsp:Transcript_40121/g.85600  ORF Transcript_40121/g.85600 Transcript_40121/m.85600 type:complete len:236 (+) Transcript_40121:1267-1974(+)
MEHQVHLTIDENAELLIAVRAQCDDEGPCAWVLHLHGVGLAPRIPRADDVVGHLGHWPLSAATTRPVNQGLERNGLPSWWIEVRVRAATADRIAHGAAPSYRGDTDKRRVGGIGHVLVAHVDTALDVLVHLRAQAPEVVHADLVPVRLVVHDLHDLNHAAALDGIRVVGLHRAEAQGRSTIAATHLHRGDDLNSVVHHLGIAASLDCVDRGGRDPGLAASLRDEELNRRTVRSAH